MKNATLSFARSSNIVFSACCLLFCCVASTLQAQVTLSGAGFGLNGTYTYSSDNCATDDLFLNGADDIEYNCATAWEIWENGVTRRYYSNNGTSSDIPPSFGWRNDSDGLPANITLTGDVFPVTLAFFSAKNVHDGILLSWETLNELNNSHFMVERSMDTKLWQSQGRVEGKGTTNEISNYQFLDPAPLSHISYYRLKQVDLNGTFEYSNIIEIRANDMSFRAYPNPVQDVISISFDKQVISELSILNMQGQIVQERVVDATNIQLSLANLPRGMYQLQVVQNNERVFRQTIVKL